MAMPLRAKLTFPSDDDFASFSCPNSESYEGGDSEVIIYKHKVMLRICKFMLDTLNSQRVCMFCTHFNISKQYRAFIKQSLPFFLFCFVLCRTLNSLQAFLGNRTPF